MSARPFATFAASVATHAAIAACVLGLGVVAGARAVEPPAPTGGTLRGDSLEIPVDEAPVSTPTPSAALPPSIPLATTTPTQTPAAARVPMPASPVSQPASGPAHAPPPSSPPPSLYGAVTDHSAVDLAATFARSFPQASRADPQWLTTPFGSAGEADVTLIIDASGRLKGDAEIRGAPSPALRAGIQRTFWLVHGHAFVALGARTTLHVSASITAGPISRLALGDGPFVSGVSSSFIELPPERRIDINVKALP